MPPQTDPDVEAGRPPAAFGPRRRRRGAAIRLDVVAVVLLGGSAGGAVRYAAVTAAPAHGGGIPWSTLAVNLAGAFILAVVVVLATEIVSSRYLRPLVGTGFCGGLTTFSSVVVSTDELFARGHAGAAALYLLLTIAGGLLAAALGLVLTRQVVRRRPAGAGRTP